MAVPGEGFGAHDGGALVVGEGLQFGKCGFEIVGEHVVGVGGEGGDLPGWSFTWHCGLFTSPGAAAAEGGEVGVGEAEVFGECGWRALRD